MYADTALYNELQNFTLLIFHVKMEYNLILCPWKLNSEQNIKQQC